MEGEVSATEAGEHLASLLVRLRLQGHLSAQHICILAHWATVAGATGSFRQFAAKPGGQTGSYQKKLDAYLKVEQDAPFYTIRMPGTDPALGERTVHDLDVVPPHEAIAAEILEDPGILAKVQAGVESEEWSAVYRNHSAVTSAPPGTVVLPLALYVDGVPFTKTDAFLGFWVYNLVTQKRHLLAVLRKSDLCGCGCRKWCSLYEVFRFLHWGFKALATGRHPEERHDGEDWKATDYDRAAEAGAPLVRAAVVLLKGDWAEFCHTFGFPTWASGAHPCLFCACDRSGLYSIDNLTVSSFPHELKTHDGYEAACAAAEVWVTITREQHARLKELLAYDRRKEQSKNRKRFLTVAFGGADLKVGAPLLI